MIFFLIFLSTILFVSAFVFFFLYGKVLGYNTKMEAAIKAFIFSGIVFAIYILPLYLTGRDSKTALFLIIVWSCFWLYMIYKQAIAPWRRVIR